ncbi:hypothetical protein C5E24_06710 [Pectobacterium parmentieri]|uniref:hypothetical protein n=1 Tax=Pectobacterium parmentieri TaxID=1905730 RepID=UPI000EB1D2D0|nr:hypothetical protein [Pectobacterium parmentieri]AYH09401.1 hypothetical protein C5E24_06710 [Pectobacterium parmentieri]
MFNAILVSFFGHRFLIPERGFSYFPVEFENRKPQISRMTLAYDRLIESLENPFSEEAELAADEIKRTRSELSDFIVMTGVIGAPFDTKDAVLYAANNHITIIAEIDF